MHDVMCWTSPGFMTALAYSAHAFNRFVGDREGSS